MSEYKEGARYDIDTLVAQNREDAKEVSSAFFETSAGRRFMADFNSDSNLKLLFQHLQLTGRPLTRDNLIAIFNSLVAIGKLPKVTEAPDQAAIQYRNPITGQIVSEDWYIIAHKATRAERDELKAVDPGFKSYCQDLIRFEMRENVNHPNSGVPQAPAEKRPGLSNSQYADLQRWVTTYRQMPTAEIKKKMNASFTPKDECEAFTANFELACKIGLL